MIRVYSIKQNFFYIQKDILLVKIEVVWESKSE